MASNSWWSEDLGNVGSDSWWIAWDTLRTCVCSAVRAVTEAQLWLSCLHTAVPSLLFPAPPPAQTLSTAAFICCPLLVRTNSTWLAVPPTNLWLHTNWLTSESYFIELDFNSSYFTELLELRSFVKWYTTRAQISNADAAPYFQSFSWLSARGSGRNHSILWTRILVQFWEPSYHNTSIRPNP